MQANHQSRIIKGLLFDLDNTLYYYEPAHTAGLHAVFSALQNKTNLSVNSLNTAYEQAKQHIKLRLHNTAASHHRLLYFQTMLEQLNIFSLTQAYDLYNLYWSAFFAAMQPVPGMKDMLHKLASIYTLAIVTNFIADIQYRKLEQLGITTIIKYLVTSEELGCEKPDAKVFLAACKKMQLRPDELCMIGDDLAADIIPAQHLGMETYWLTSQQENIKPEHSLFKTCSTFYEIEERLQ
ncbi:HAD family hydrolase [Candidatus Dependentiae bacterium]|nr:HAD family hydrolase [Candidatus Dependentiae bacterium]